MTETNRTKPTPHRLNAVIARLGVKRSWLALQLGIGYPQLMAYLRGRVRMPPEIEAALEKLLERPGAETSSDDQPAAPAA